MEPNISKTLGGCFLFSVVARQRYERPGIV